MPAKKNQQSKPVEPKRKLVQVWLDPKVAALLKHKAEGRGLEVPSYLRQMIYADVVNGKG